MLSTGCGLAKKLHQVKPRTYGTASDTSSVVDKIMNLRPYTSMAGLTAAYIHFFEHEPLSTTLLMGSIWPVIPIKICVGVALTYLDKMPD